MVPQTRGGTGCYVSVSKASYIRSAPSWTGLAWPCACDEIGRAGRYTYQQTLELPLSPTINDLTARLESFLVATVGSPVHVVNLRQLTGGSQFVPDTWSFDKTGGSGPGLVLRRDMGGTISDEALRSREHEFRVTGDCSRGRRSAFLDRWSAGLR